MRRREDHSLNTRVSKSFGKTSMPFEAAGVGEFLTCRIGFGGTHDFYVIARPLQDGCHFPAPPPEADHRYSDGGVLAIVMPSDRHENFHVIDGCVEKRIKTLFNHVIRVDLRGTDFFDR